MTQLPSCDINPCGKFTNGIQYRNEPLQSGPEQIKIKDYYREVQPKSIESTQISENKDKGNADKCTAWLEIYIRKH